MMMIIRLKPVLNQTPEKKFEPIYWFFSLFDRKEWRVTLFQKVVDQVIEHSGPASSSEETKNSTVPEVKIEDEKGVLVFVSEYCVIERERFVKGCHGDIDKKEVKLYNYL